MVTEDFQLKTNFPVTSKDIYDRWLSSEGHAAITGGEASIEPVEGTAYSAWDGYITGTVKELEPGKRMLMSWRTSEFPEDAEDSLVEILLKDTNDGCSLTLNHTNIPEGQGSNYNQGWEDHYFSPMRDYFGN